ncbi:hypothetical protein [Actinomadura sp. NPDC000600]|uniref:hypothetical protein n=1 Tax=Actinomadura sp. NPDC000600 TaxID=3154262 RepID=UPI003393E63C
MTAQENQAAVRRTLRSLDGGDQVASTTDPYETGAVSKDGTIAYSTISYTAGAVDLTAPTKNALRHAADRGLRGRHRHSPDRPSRSGVGHPALCLSRSDAE